MPSATLLGKRKRKPAQKVEEDTGEAALEDAQTIFRRHFEAQFAPIQNEPGGDATKPGGKSKKGQASAKLEDDDEEDGIEDMRSDSESGEEENDEWGGLSGDEDSSQAGEEDAESDFESEADEVEVVDYSKPLPSSSTLAAQNATMTKREMRAYLSSRPPDSTLTGTTSTSKTSRRTEGDDDPQNEDSKSLLANDLALQRLISESHILSASNPFNSIGSRGASSADVRAFTEGRIRKRTTDLRLQKLGSKESIFTQRKMPMNMRKGILAARESREEKRRREARENGIILERAQDKSGKKSARKSKKGRGDVDVDMPGMGKFKNGELRLSKREVKAVEMEGMRMDNGGKRKRRRR